MELFTEVVEEVESLWPVEVEDRGNGREDEKEGGVFVGGVNNEP